MSDLNYRLSVMLNNSAASLHHQNDVDTVKIEDKTNKPDSMSLMVIYSLWWSLHSLPTFQLKC
jgi:hypothetical protein